MSGSSTASAVTDALAYSPTLPWTLLTYPFAPYFSGVLMTALMLWVLHQFLSDIERRLGIWGTLIFFFTMTFLGGLCYFSGTIISPGKHAPIPTIGLVAEFVVFTWCVVNPSAQIRLFMIIPVATLVLMWLTVAAVVIEYGWGNVPLGLSTALPMVAAWAYATDRIPGLKFGQRITLATKKNNQEFTGFLDNVLGREKERVDRERLRELFERSLGGEDKEA